MKSDRRTFLLGLLGCGTLTVTQAGILHSHRYTEIADARKGQFRIVLLDGVDISRDCYCAATYESGVGWADCYLRNKKDEFYFDGIGVAQQRRYGKVKLLPRAKIKVMDVTSH